MDTKKLIWIGAVVGGAIGGYIPILFGADGISFSSIIGSTIGGIFGIYGTFKLTRM